MKNKNGEEVGSFSVDEINESKQVIRETFLSNNSVSPAIVLVFIEDAGDWRELLIENEVKYISGILFT